MSLPQTVRLYGRDSCPDCARIKRLFAKNLIEYQYLDVDKDPQALEFASDAGGRLPVVVLPDQTVLIDPSDTEVIEKLGYHQKGLAAEPHNFDTIIIGGGPAGLSAAIYAVRKSLKVLIVTKDIGGQAALSGQVENYLGYSLISGFDLASKFRSEVERFKGDGLWIKEGVEVKNIEGGEDQFRVETEGQTYQGKTVIIASGRVPRMLGVPGEKELLGKGVATCATCDAPFYKGKDVAVVGGGNSALDAAYSLMKIAKTVTILDKDEAVHGDEILMKNVTTAPNVKILTKVDVVSIQGKERVSGVTIKDASGAVSEIPVEGIFIEIGWEPSVNFAPKLAKNEKGEIIVDEFGKTSEEGIWAAGDVNNLWGEQIIIAAGEGAKVALVVAEHIAKIPHQASSNAHETG